MRYKGFVVPIDVTFDDAVAVDKGLVFSDAVARRLRVDDALTFHVCVGYRFSNQCLQNSLMEQFSGVVVMK